MDTRRRGETWEDTFEKHALECGFEKLASMRSCFLHRSLRVFMVVYVDGIKIAGPAAGRRKTWAMLTSRFSMYTPTKPDRFLGCYLKTFTASVHAVRPVLDAAPDTLFRGQSDPVPRQFPDTSREVRGYMYDMESTAGSRTPLWMIWSTRIPLSR